jgi:hypothetical protein
MNELGLPPAGGSGEAVVVLVFALALVLGGGLVVGLAQLEQWEARRSRHWPAVMGWVICSQARQVPTHTGYVYSAEIAYAYTVGATRYVGRRVRFAQPGYGPGAQRDWSALTVQRYPVGQPMAVYYDPRRPERAVLERPARPPLPAPLLLGAAMLAVGLVSGLSSAVALAGPLVH